MLGHLQISGYNSSLHGSGHVARESSGMMSFGEFVLRPITNTQQKKKQMKACGRKAHDLLPELLEKYTKVSNAAKQWKVTEQLNMENTIQLSKITNPTTKFLYSNVKDTHSMNQSPAKILDLRFVIKKSRAQQKNNGSGCDSQRYIPGLRRLRNSSGKGVHTSKY